MDLRIDDPHVIDFLSGGHFAMEDGRCPNTEWLLAPWCRPSGQAGGEAALIYGIRIPAGYRQLIPLARRRAFNQLRSTLGNRLRTVQ